MQKAEPFGVSVTDLGCFCSWQPSRQSSGVLTCGSVSAFCGQHGIRCGDHTDFPTVLGAGRLRPRCRPLSPVSLTPRSSPCQGLCPDPVLYWIRTHTDTSFGLARL